MVADTIEELLRSYVRSRLGGNASDESAGAAFAEKKAGDLYDEEWLDMCRFMYGGREMAGLRRAARGGRSAVLRKTSATRSSAPLIVDEQNEGTRLFDRGPSRELEVGGRGDARESVCRVDFVQTCLFHGLAAREDARTAAEARQSAARPLSEGRGAKRSSPTARTRARLARRPFRNANRGAISRPGPPNAGRSHARGRRARARPGSRRSSCSAGGYMPEESKASHRRRARRAVHAVAEGNVFGRSSTRYLTPRITFTKDQLPDHLSTKTNETPPKSLRRRRGASRRGRRDRYRENRRTRQRLFRSLVAKSKLKGRSARFSSARSFAPPGVVPRAASRSKARCAGERSTGQHSARSPSQHRPRKAPPCSARRRRGVRAPES